jgi:hypothetical protein
MASSSATLPHKWRVTRYDPALRNKRGNYSLGDWSFFAQVGQVFNGEELTFQRYLGWEMAYANAASAFLADAGLDALQIEYLENKNIKNVNAEQYKDISLEPKSLRAGMLVAKDDLANVVRLNLREVIWCKLATGYREDSRFYLHFGWDFYMYIGSSLPSVKAIRYAESIGLFVEPKRSPYLETDD